MAARSSPKKNNEIVGNCLHPSDDHYLMPITWEKAKKKCIKRFGDPCPHFIRR